MSPAASAFVKIHPSTYLGLISLGCFLIFRSERKNNKSRNAAIRMIVSVCFILFFYVMVSEGEGGGEISALIVTFMSAGLLALLFDYAEPITLRRLRFMLSVFFIANSMLGLIELSSGQRLMPFVISEEVISWDLRPTALLGHPLLNSLLTGAWVLTLVIRGFKDGIKPSGFVVLATNVLAMFAFGGRAALVAMLLIAMLYMILKAFTALLAASRTTHVLFSFFGLYVALLFVPVILITDLAAPIVGRFVDAKGSDETRYAAVQMLSTLNLPEWLLGISSDARNSLQASAGSVHGIEISWVALILQFGLPITACLLVLTWQLLNSAARSGLERFTLVSYFFVTTFTSLSIGSKSLLISQVFLIIAVSIPIRSS